MSVNFIHAWPLFIIRMYTVNSFTLRTTFAFLARYYNLELYWSQIQAQNNEQLIIYI